MVICEPQKRDLDADRIRSVSNMAPILERSDSSNRLLGPFRHSKLEEKLLVLYRGQTTIEKLN